MNIRKTRLAIAAAVVGLGVLLEADAATLLKTWSPEPNTAVLAAVLPSGQSAAGDMTIAATADGTVFLAWEDPARTELRVQKLKPSGARAWGAAGVAARTGAGGIVPVGDRRVLSDGPLDVFPTSDGGVLVAWAESSATGRDLRAQRLDAKGRLRLGAQGVAVFPGMPDADSFAAVLPDGHGGLDAVATFGSATGALHFQHLDADGSLTFNTPGPVLDAQTGEKRYPVLARMPDGAVFATWTVGGAQRMQIVAGATLRIPQPGVDIATEARAAYASVAVTGTTDSPLVLVSHLNAAGDTPYAVLVAPDGAVIRREASGTTEAVAGQQLRDAPTISTIGGVANGDPEGIELHGIRNDGTAVRFLRMPSGGWNAPETVVPSAQIFPGQTGALAGPLWTWDMGNRSADSERLRVVAYRDTTVGTDLVPRLGPWLTMCPGFDDGSRLVRVGRLLHLAWVYPSSKNGSIRVTRVASAPGPGESELLAPRISSLTVGAVAPKPLDVSAPTASLPLRRGAKVRLVLGDDGGRKAVLRSTRVVRGGTTPQGFTATLKSSDGKVTAQLRTGDAGLGLDLHVDGYPIDPGDRALYLRLEARREARQAMVLLTPGAGGGASFSGTSP